MRHHALLLVLIVPMLIGLLPTHTPRPGAPVAAHAAELAALPAPVPGAPAPSMALSVAAGYAGQTVTVSGEGGPGFAGVRIVWLLEGATYAAAVVSVADAERYTATISVPPEAAIGPAQICVAASGSEQAAFACADFTVETPPPASLDFQLPAALLPTGAALQQGGDATFSLLDMAGKTIATAPVQANGRVQIATIPPGVYQPILSGVVAQLSEFSALELGPAQMITSVLPQTPAVRRVDPVTREFCDNADALVAAIGARYADAGRFTPPRIGTASTANTRSDFAAFRDTYYGPNPRYNMANTQAQQPALGWYISGVELQNQFSATVQSRFFNSVQRVEVWRRNADAVTFTRVANLSPVGGVFVHTQNVGEFAPGAAELAFAPVVNGVRQCSRRVTLNVALDPLVGMFANTRTRWNAEGYYEFDGTMPQVPGLPVELPLNIEYLGDLGTRMNAGLRIRGFIELNQVLTLDLLDAELVAKIVGQNLLNERRTLLPPGTRYQPGSPRNLAIPVELHNLPMLYQSITIFRGTIFSWFGIFNLNGAVGAQFGAGQGRQYQVCVVERTQIDEMCAIVKRRRGAGQLLIRICRAHCIGQP